MNNNLNKTIHTFSYNGKYYEIDWLTDATSLPGQKVCDIFQGIGKKAKVVGQIVINNGDNNEEIKNQAIGEIDSYIED